MTMRTSGKQKLDKAKQQLCTCITFSVHFFAITAQLPCENAYFHILWRMRIQAMTNFSFSFFGYGWEEFSSRRSEFACIWQSKQDGIMMIKIEKMQSHFSSNVFTAISRRGILNSLIFMKARSMQASIPVVSSSLYFWKSVFKIPLHTFLCFSFWEYSILKWVAYIKLKVSWLHAFLWCMSQIKTIAMMYKLTKRTQELLFANSTQ